MQKAVVRAYSPYEVGDTVEVTILEGMAVTGFPKDIRTMVMKITDILTLHSFKNNTVTFLYDLESVNEKVSCSKIRIVPWVELVRR